MLLSAFNREIAKSGHLTQLGIWHKNQFNDFNLSCDLMEPFRVLIDKIAFEMNDNDDKFKKRLIDILNEKVTINGKSMFVDNAIEIYVQSVIASLNENDVSKIKFFDI
ncbi:MAG: CRISPR-associated endonuclease Cas1 [Clostridia bacterium]|nr:CRISPR-associated endonuclease Cas1 [Clostridia bacterium]